MLDFTNDKLILILLEHKRKSHKLINSEKKQLRSLQRSFEINNSEQLALTPILLKNGHVIQTGITFDFNPIKFNSVEITEKGISALKSNFYKSEAHREIKQKRSQRYSKIARYINIIIFVFSLIAAIYYIKFSKQESHKDILIKKQQAQIDSLKTKLATYKSFNLRY
jgi:hypothetical protein